MSGRHTRGTGRSLRERHANPRALATNPSAGTERDRRRVFAAINRAYALLHAGGLVWCERCADDGFVPAEGDRFGRCDDHRGLTYREAVEIELAGRPP